MIDTNQQFESSDHEDLVAYLDGELDADKSKHIEDRLSNDAEFRQLLNKLQRSWDFLDDLPRVNTDEDFTRTTIEMVAVKAAEDIKQAEHKETRARWIKWLVGAGSVAATFVIGYASIAHVLDRDNRQLVRDLPIIERVDMYRNVDNIEFLISLDDADLFGEEVDDELQP